MAGSYLLDTNTAIDLVEGRPGPTARFEADHQVYLNIVSLGELYYGAFKSQRVEENLRRFAEFAAASTVVGCDDETARQYGTLKTELRRKGRPIPENDIWIAAIAKRHGLTLVTRDGHYEHFEDLDKEAW